jgi:hypothetical protein
MADDNSTPVQKNPDGNDQSQSHSGENISAPDGDGTPERGLLHFLRNVIFAGVAATGIWVIGEHFHDLGYDMLGSSINFIASVVFFAVLPFEAARHWPRPCIVWSLFVLFISTLAFDFLGLHPRKALTPHFALSLQIGDSQDASVLLTNDFLSCGRIETAGDLPNGRIMFSGHVFGCLVVPVHPGETNKTFRFTAENDSPVKVADLEMSVTFPKYWECKLDPIKWRTANMSLIVPRTWRFEATNIQSWFAECSLPAFPGDQIMFPPITNPCVPEFIGSTIKGGLVVASVRSTDFEDIIMANIIFVPVKSNCFNPFVTLGKQDSAGHLNISTPPYILAMWIASGNGWIRPSRWSLPLDRRDSGWATEVLRRSWLLLSPGVGLVLGRPTASP